MSGYLIKNAEVWKDVVGWEGIYQVSNLGRIKSLKFGEKILKLNKGYRGYFQVNFLRNGKRTTYSVHRLVAEAFIPNPNNKIQINHKDLNKINNHVGNLEWCTNEENARHAISNGVKWGHRGSLNSNAKLHEKDIPEIRKLLLKGLNQQKIAEMFGVNSRTIHNVKSGRRWGHVK